MVSKARLPKASGEQVTGTMEPPIWKEMLGPTARIYQCSCHCQPGQKLYTDRGLTKRTGDTLLGSSSLKDRKNGVLAVAVGSTEVFV